MNMYFVYADGHIVTPEVGTILEGITRSSIIELAGKLGHQVEERKFSVDEWRDGVASGDIVEVFACGTAAVVTPVGQLRWDGGEVGERRRRRRRADHADPPGAGRHPVRPGRRHVRLDAPGLLTRLTLSYRSAARPGFGVRPVTLVGVTVSSGSPRPQAPPGLTVGGYTLLTRLGEGGMGVVHLARKPGGERVALKVLRPHIVGDDEARARLAREVSSLQPDPQQVGGRDRRRRPVGADPVRGHPLRARLLAARPGAGGGPGQRRRPDLAGPLAGRGHRQRARRRRAPPRRQAVQRADGGPDPDPHRLRPGPRRRRPQAHPHRLAARHARLPRRPRSSTATTRRPPPTSTRGPRPSRTPASAGRRSAPGPSMAIMDRVRRGEHDLTGLPDALRQVVERRARPRPGAAAEPRPDPRPARPRRTTPRTAAALAGRGRPTSPRTCSRCRWRSRRRRAWRRGPRPTTAATEVRPTAGRPRPPGRPGQPVQP